jgi:membrane associated rhomboid family serine protease
VTFQFLHGSWLHLVANLVLLHSMGPVLETTLGHRRYLFLYLGAGAVGGLVHAGAAFAWPAHFGQPVVGASAGLCGLLAAVGYLYADDRVKGLLLFVIPFEVKAKVLLLLAGLVSILGVMLPFGRVAHFAHLGGLLGGLIMLRLMRVRAVPAEATVEASPAAEAR